MYINYGVVVGLELLLRARDQGDYNTASTVLGLSGLVPPGEGEEPLSVIIAPVETGDNDWLGCWVAIERMVAPYPGAAEEQQLCPTSVMEVSPGLYSLVLKHRGFAQEVPSGYIMIHPEWTMLEEDLQHVWRNPRRR